MLSEKEQSVFVIFWTPDWWKWLVLPLWLLSNGRIARTFQVRCRKGRLKPGFSFLCLFCVIVHLFDWWMRALGLVFLSLRTMFSEQGWARAFSAVERQDGGGRKSWEDGRWTSSIWQGRPAAWQNPRQRRQQGCRERPETGDFRWSFVYADSVVDTHTHTQHWLQHNIKQSNFICNGLICIFVLNYVSLDHFGFAFSNSVLLGLGFSTEPRDWLGRPNFGFNLPKLGLRLKLIWTIRF